ncbi:MAG: HD domain-containing protein [Chloroflexota bacterium]|nr:MAG: HD domain-containing protein [Chloroflexota bacterium]
MSTSRLVYRTRQFWQAISTRASREDMELASTILSSSEFELFQQMHKSEQAHSLRVLRGLINQGEENPDLHTAALLHDVGKILAPLRVWERVMVVLVKAFCPGCLQKWGTTYGEDSPEELGWRRAFIVSEQHPAWGADLASQSGVSELAVSLIARHQEQLPLAKVNQDSVEDNLLYKLQAVDNQS